MDTTASSQWVEAAVDVATDFDVSHTNCASLVTDAQRQRPDKNNFAFNQQGRGHWRRDHDHNQIVAWRQDHWSFKFPTITALTAVLPRG